MSGLLQQQPRIITTHPSMCLVASTVVLPWSICLSFVCHGCHCAPDVMWSVLFPVSWLLFHFIFVSASTPSTAFWTAIKPVQLVLIPYGDPRQTKIKEHYSTYITVYLVHSKESVIWLRVSTEEGDGRNRSALAYVDICNCCRSIHGTSTTLLYVCTCDVVANMYLSLYNPWD